LIGVGGREYIEIIDDICQTTDGDLGWECYIDEIIH